MTLNQIKTSVATIFGRTPADLSISGTDMFLVAVNQVRRDAELLHDFEFSRRLLTLSVNGVTGGSLDDAVVKGTTTHVKTKTVIDMGMFDEGDNLRPSEWTTVAEGLERQRANTRFTPRYPTDQDLRSGPRGVPRFEVSGNQVFRFGKDPTVTWPVGLEVYTFNEDWIASDLDPVATVTGSISPAVDGAYPYVGTYKDRPFYYILGAQKFVFHNGTRWVISNQPFPVIDVNHFTLNSLSASPVGTYIPMGAATGSPILTLSGVASENDWTVYGHSYLTWASVVYLNHLFKTFVFRQEGNLPPPEKIRDAALAAFIEWDAAKFETNRRHG